MNGEIVAGRVHAQIRAGADFYYCPLLSSRRVSRDSPREVGREARRCHFVKCRERFRAIAAASSPNDTILYVSQRTLANAIRCRSQASAETK